MDKVKIDVWVLRGRFRNDQYDNTYAIQRDHLPFGGFLAQGYQEEICEQVSVDSQSNEHLSAVHNSKRKRND